MITLAEYAVASAKMNFPTSTHDFVSVCGILQVARTRPPGIPARL